MGWVWYSHTESHRLKVKLCVLKMECFLFLKENYSWDEMRGRARAGAVLSPSCLMLGTSPVGRCGCLKRQVLRSSLDGNFQICAGGLLRAWWQVLSNYIEARKRGSECDSVWLWWLLAYGEFCCLGNLNHLSYDRDPGRTVTEVMHRMLTWCLFALILQAMVTKLAICFPSILQNQSTAEKTREI